MKDELLITDMEFGDVGSGVELRLQVRWAAESGDAMHYSVNGRRVPGEVYDRILSTVKARSLDEIAGILAPENEHGIVSKLDDIHDAINENERGEHRESVADAISRLIACLPDR